MTARSRWSIDIAHIFGSSRSRLWCQMDIIFSSTAVETVQWKYPKTSNTTPSRRGFAYVYGNKRWCPEALHCCVFCPSAEWWLCVGRDRCCCHCSRAVGLQQNWRGCNCLTRQDLQSINLCTQSLYDWWICSNSLTKSVVCLRTYHLNTFKNKLSK